MKSPKPATDTIYPHNGKIIKISSINRIILYHILGIFGKLKVKGGRGIS
jgi:hypothetical protein